MNETREHQHREPWAENPTSKPCPDCGCIVLTLADGCRFRRGDFAPHRCPVDIHTPQ